MAKTNRYPKHGLRWATGEIFDDVKRSVSTTSTATPLSKPSAGTVKSKHLGNALNATPPDDPRVVGYAVYRATSNSISAATFQENIKTLPWTDHQSTTNDLISTVHYYWLVSLDRAWAHYQTVALDAFFMGYS